MFMGGCPPQPAAAITGDLFLMSFDLTARLAARRAANLYRQRPLLESPQGPQVVVDGQPLLAFCSNDYLGLANHPQVIEAW